MALNLNELFCIGLGILGPVQLDSLCELQYEWTS
jgi:hypothetical protein